MCFEPEPQLICSNIRRVFDPSGWCNETRSWIRKNSDRSTLPPRPAEFLRIQLRFKECLSPPQKKEINPA
jgi:hypothetical protein